MRAIIRFLILAALLALSSGTNAATTVSSSPNSPVSPTQRGTIFNQAAVSGANTVITITIAAAANQRARLHNVDAFCSAGTSQIVVNDGGTTIFFTPAIEVGTARTRVSWGGTPLSGSINTTMTVSLQACGVGNTGTIITQAERY